MKRFLLPIIVAVVIAPCAFVLASCGSPQLPDTSAVAGKYFQHVGNTQSGEIIAGKWIKLNSDGTWTTQEETKVGNVSGNFTIDGKDISFYSGTMRTMYGTIENEKMELHVWYIVGWQDLTFYKE